jgi:alginate O-acetyltransferase complex protein AlgI
VVWGAFHGGWLALHRALRARLPRLPERAAIVGHVVCVAVTFQGVCLGWLFFRAESLDQARRILCLMAGGLHFDPWAWSALTELLSYSLPLVAFQALQAFKGEAWVLRSAPPLLQGAVFGALFYLVALYGAVSDAFIYFQF